MRLEEIILKHLQELPRLEKAEVLNFIEYLRTKTEKRTDLTRQRFPYPLQCETREMKTHHIHLMISENPFHDDILLGEMGQIEGIRLEG
jgi:hypothetical protein